MILPTDKMLFVTDKDDSDKWIENLRTEHETNQYRIKIDRTTYREYYELFHEWMDGKRRLNDRLFASNDLQKIVDYINRNI